MTDRYAVINPETLMAMRRAGHVAKLEARIEKLDAALREIAANACCDSCREAALVARKALDAE